MTLFDYYLWGAGVIETLKDNIREAIGEIQLHTIDNVLKNWNWNVPRQPFEIIFHY